ncbi:dentin sialophosphoprotein-like [Hibiscus syriacus]|uniref:Dentin sialophosphoprotein-like n=1 Tax=Hibiscus syriacus TaxID=106335 RepID=A0A6A2XV91_HIBSY|nr:dentin sialophosphoprotein-like [Hibiscus syriacus]
MESQNPIKKSNSILESTPNGQIFDPHESYDDSTCSTPYVSAPSSPGRAPGPGPGSFNGYGGGGFYYSAPSSPMHFAITSVASKISSTQPSSPDNNNSVALGFEFEFSARYGSSSPGSGQTGSMSSADELFLNGKIRPMKLFTHLERPQALAPLMDLQHEEEEEDDDDDNEVRVQESDTNETSAASSRSSSAGRSSKRWVFLKDFLRSKSEGTGRSNKFWSTISFSPATKEKKPTENQRSTKINNKPVNGVMKRRVVPPSPHELHYTANRAQAEEMRKKTFLPYRQGLLGCLGFSSKGYGAMNGFCRALNPVSSR